MEPMTSVVALVRPRPFTNSLSAEVAVVVMVFASVLKEPRVTLIQCIVPIRG
jgi:hypothetical protein